MTANAVQERYTAVRADIDALNVKGALDKTDALRMEELVTEAQGLRKQIEMQAQVGELDAAMGRSAGMLPLAGRGGANVESFTAAGVSAFSRTKDGALRIEGETGDGLFDQSISAQIGTPEYKEAFRSWIKQGRNAPDAAIRTLSEGADPSGGFLVPLDILNKVIVKEPTPTRVAGRVTQLTTSRDRLAIPKVNYAADDNYTTGMRVTWTGEVPASSTAMRVTDPVFGQTTVPIYTAMMSIPVTRDLIEDSMFDLLGFISGKFAETIDLLKDNMILNGTGLGQPSGILVNPGATSNPAVVVSGSASALTADGLLKTAFSLPEQYQDNAVWVMNLTNTGQALSLLKDSNNRYLWGAGLQDSGLAGDFMTRRLVGREIIWSGFMPNVGASTYPAIYGDLKGYYFVNRIGFAVEVLRELYAETNQVLVLGRIRFGGQVAEDWKIKIHQAHT